MIPKVIHYCWFGHNPLPPLAIKCIESWKKHLPDYEIKEWNEDNFDVNIIPYTAEAYEAKKYAFVSDYARFWILYKYGGLYFDTDVEVIRPLDDIVERGPFMGFESATSTDRRMMFGVNPGLGLAVSPDLGLYKEFLDYYSGLHFVDSFGQIVEQQTIVHHTTDVLRRLGLKEMNEIQQVGGVWIYPCDFFCPIDVTTKHLMITKNTRTIHHYAASWMGKSIIKRMKERLQPYIPSILLLLWNRLKSKFIK